MLINAVVIFLRDLLPALLLLSVSAAALPKYSRLLLGSVLALAGLSTALISSQLASIAGWFDGLGHEYLNTALYCACYLLIAVSVGCRQHSQWSWRWLALAGVCLLTINGTNLTLFLFFYSRSAAETQSLLLGSALGLGISLSITVLLYYVIDLTKHYYRDMAWLLLSLVAARQLGEVYMLLVQVDVIDTHPPLWNSNAWLADTSEYGHFLQALLGYEATPSLPLLLLLGGGTLVLLTLMKLTPSKPHSLEAI